MSRSAPRWCAFFLAAALAPSAYASGDNLAGGRVVTRTQLYVSFGFPEAELGVHIPIKKFELTPNLRFTYGIGPYVGFMSLDPGISARWQVFGDKGPWAGSITASVPVMFNLNGLLSSGYPGYEPSVRVGVGLLNPGFMATYTAGPIVDVNLGVGLDATLQLDSDGPRFYSDALLKTGVEFHTRDRTQVAVRFEGGPGLGSMSGSEALDVYPVVRGSLGFGHSF